MLRFETSTSSVSMSMPQYWLMAIRRTVPVQIMHSGAIRPTGSPCSRSSPSYGFVSRISVVSAHGRLDGKECLCRMAVGNGGNPGRNVVADISYFSGAFGRLDRTRLPCEVLQQMAGKIRQRLRSHRLRKRLDHARQGGRLYHYIKSVNSFLRSDCGLSEIFATRSSVAMRFVSFPWNREGWGASGFSPTIEQMDWMRVAFPPQARA